MCKGLREGGVLVLVFGEERMVYVEQIFGKLYQCFLLLLSVLAGQLFFDAVVGQQSAGLGAEAGYGIVQREGFGKFVRGERLFFL